MDVPSPIDFPHVAACANDAPQPDSAPPARVKTLLHAFPTFEVGGSQVRFAAFANHYGARYRHLIVTMNGRSDCLDRIHPDVPCEMVDIAAPKNQTIRNFFSLRHRLSVLRPDVLVTYNWGSIEWALANIVPICRHIHIEDGFGPDEIATGPLRRRSLFRRLVLSHRTQVILPSQTLMTIAADKWRLPQRNVAYVPNGIDCSRFMANPDPRLARQFRRTPEEFVIGTVATLRAEKNLGRLIEAFAKVLADVPARLVIVGDGVERDRLQWHAVRHGVEDKVVFTGALANPERILGAFDLFALSSNTEQMPFSILEAMSAGLPIAAVDVGDVRAMLSAENRPYVTPRTADGLAKAITALLRDPRGRAEIGLANRAHARTHYDQTTMFERYAALFDA